MNKWQLALLIIVQVLLSFAVVSAGYKGIDTGFPIWSVFLIISAWFTFCFEIDRYIWAHDIRKIITSTTTQEEDLIQQKRDNKRKFVKRSK